MKRLVLSATALAIAFAVAPGAQACSGSQDAESPQHTGTQTDRKHVASDADLTVLMGLLLGIVLADPAPAATPCPGCTDAR
jgi:hypothetical protein